MRKHMLTKMIKNIVITTVTIVPLRTTNDNQITSHMSYPYLRSYLCLLGKFGTIW